MWWESQEMSTQLSSSSLSNQSSNFMNILTFVPVTTSEAASEVGVARPGTRGQLRHGGCCHEAGPSLCHPQAAALRVTGTGRGLSGWRIVREGRNEDTLEEPIRVTILRETGLIPASSIVLSKAKTTKTSSVKMISILPAKMGTVSWSRDIIYKRWLQRIVLIFHIFIFFAEKSLIIQNWYIQN